MGPESANLAGSVAKSLEVDRSPHATQRASEIAQDQLAGESVAALTRKAPSAANHVRREKIRQDRERRRRELERRIAHEKMGDSTDSDEDTTLDVVA